MGRTCVVPGCKSSSFKAPQLRFFGFPKNEQQKKLWIYSMEIGLGHKIDENSLHPLGRICQFHFRDEDFEKVPSDDGTVWLKRIVTSVPSVFGERQLQADPSSNKKCRICLREKGTIGLETDCIPGISVNQAVYKTFNFSLNLHPNFSQFICQNCCKFLISAHSFKVQIIKTDATLQEQSRLLLSKKRSYKHEMKNETLTLVEVPAITATNSKSSNQNVFFFIKDFSQEDVKVKPEMAIEGDQLSFSQPLSDDDEVMEVEIKKEIIDVDESSGDSSQPPLDIGKMLQVKLEHEDKLKKEVELREKFPSKVCKKCQFRAESATDLVEHLENSENDCLAAYDTPTFECLLCQRKFIEEQRKIQHMTNDHKNSDIPECRFCNKNVFKNIDAYEKHLAYHLMPPKCICAICGTGYHERKPLLAHMKIHDENFNFTCDICGFSTKHKGGLKGHLKRHANIRPFMCEKCPRNFSNNVELKRHYFSKHKYIEDGCYLCVKCDYCYLSKKHYRMHITRCSGNSSNSYPRKAPRIQRKDLDPRCIIKPQPE